MTDERRQRDISIAKKLGWTVRQSGMYFAICSPRGSVSGGYEAESHAWNGVPEYSTDPAACMALLVEVMGRGWQIGFASTHRLVMHPVYLESGGVIGVSTLTDPALAFADAVSQACEAALEAEGGVGYDARTD